MNRAELEFGLDEHKGLILVFLFVCMLWSIFALFILEPTQMLNRTVAGQIMKCKERLSWRAATGGIIYDVKMSDGAIAKVEWFGQTPIPHPSSVELRVHEGMISEKYTYSFSNDVQH